MTPPSGGVLQRVTTGLCLLVLFAGAAAQELEQRLPPVDTDRRGQTLDVSIAIFDTGIPDDTTTHRSLAVFPRIRAIESLFLPFVLRESLNRSAEWRAVRVVPEADPASELLISATILQSDGETLKLGVRAVDATGRVWLDDSFVTRSRAAYAQSDGEPGYSGIYDQVGKRLRTYRDSLERRELERIADVSLMRYANGLVPEAFGEYVDAADGRYTLLRLPAENDPMLGRIRRLRTVENAITDVVDEKYEELHAEIASTYDVWRAYRRKFRRYQADEALLAASETSDTPRDSYESMMERYERYKWDRLASQEQEGLAQGFDNEVGPTIERIETRIAELRGWVEEETATWERILAEFYELETELAAPGT